MHTKKTQVSALCMPRTTCHCYFPSSLIVQVLNEKKE